MCPHPAEPKQTEEQRDQIVLDHLPLVKAIAIRVHENLPVHVDLDDLIHAGVMGLFDAVTKYDGAKNVAFHSYAKHRIKGAILDSLRQLDWASRDLRRRQKQVEGVTRELASKLGRTPNDNEVADQMGVGLERWHRMRMEMRTVGAVSATPNPDQDRERTLEFAATPEYQPDRMCERHQLQHTLARAIGTLPGALSESGLPVLHQRHDDEGDRRRDGRQRKPRFADPQDGPSEDGRSAAVRRHPFHGRPVIDCRYSGSANRYDVRFSRSFGASL